MAAPRLRAVACALLAAAALAAAALPHGAAADGQLPDAYREPVTLVRCPVEGGYRLLKRTAARLMAEGNVLWSQACFRAATRAFLSGKKDAVNIPMAPARFREVFPGTHERPDEEFDSVAAMAERRHGEMMDRYSVRRLHLTPQPGDYYFRRRRPSEAPGQDAFH